MPRKLFDLNVGPQAGPTCWYHAFKYLFKFHGFIDREGKYYSQWKDVSYFKKAIEAAYLLDRLYSKAEGSKFQNKFGEDAGNEISGQKAKSYIVGKNHEYWKREGRIAQSILKTAKDAGFSFDMEEAEIKKKAAEMEAKMNKLELGLACEIFLSSKNSGLHRQDFIAEIGKFESVMDWRPANKTYLDFKELVNQVDTYGPLYISLAKAPRAILQLEEADDDFFNVRSRELISKHMVGRPHAMVICGYASDGAADDRVYLWDSRVPNLTLWAEFWSFWTYVKAPGDKNEAVWGYYLDCRGCAHVRNARVKPLRE
ncbi:TPA: hypothetical protein ACXNP4_003476 [Pseudomonas aeruginosa]|uniref:hypothetical protein n=1 Tax=Pseudomonas aeruginosa TaxID=287 RepID=UPI0036D58734|nr:hypothetical protein [Pseudomonas aeruginosa]